MGAISCSLRLCYPCEEDAWRGYFPVFVGKKMLAKVPLLYTFCPMKTMSEQPRVTLGSSAAERKRIYHRLAAGELQRVMPGVMAEADTLLTDVNVGLYFLP